MSTETNGREIAVVEQPEETPSRALTLSQREQVAGLIRPVAPPSDVLDAQNDTRELIAKALQKGRDYGEIPGTNKPSLLKPGAERIGAAFGTYPRYRVVEKEIDHDRETHYTKEKWVTRDRKPDNWQVLKTQGVGRNRKFDNQWKWQEKESERGLSLGLYRYVVECEIVHRASGVVIGQGLGSCSTMESKYIDRPRDLENTVLKMAEKRALVGAVLNTFGLSDQFTQDVEDITQEVAEETGEVEEPSYEQLALMDKLMRSHVLTDLERERLKRALQKENTKPKATAQIEWLLQTIRDRKAAEKKATAGQPQIEEPEVDEALAASVA